MTAIFNNASNIEEKYGFRWLLIFYHNSRGNLLFTQNSPELLSCNTAQRFSTLGSLTDKYILSF